jgi:hypothetical protein
MSDNEVSYLVQSLRGKIGLSMWYSGKDCHTTVTTTFWLDPRDAEGIARMLLREVDSLPRMVEASDFGLEVTR